MQKILYAINHRQTEDSITKRISESYLNVGAVTYKEAVLEKLVSTGADTLLIREGLPGSTDFERLLKKIKVECPNVRVIVICSERPKQDPFLQMMVNLAIYDIINSDKPTLGDIVSYIMSPRTFRDAAQFGIGLPESPKPATPSVTTQPAAPVQQETQKKSFMSSLGGFFKPKNKTTQQDAPAPSTAPIPETPQVNVELLRETLRETEARNAQQNLDAMIRQAVDQRTATLNEENKRLNEEIAKLQSALSDSDSHSMNISEQLNTLRSEKDRIQLAYDDLRRQTQEGYEAYEQQIRALQNPVNTPQWYQEQMSAWESQKSTLTASLEAKTKEASDLASEVEFLKGQAVQTKSVIENLQSKLQQSTEMVFAGKEADELVAQLRESASTAKQESINLKKELDRVKEELKTALNGGPDYSRPIVSVPLLPDDTIYTSTGLAPQTIMLVGAKHGVGATTIAMNLAASIAGKGLKTLLIEMNGNFPMLNEYFEFTSVPYGINEALTDIASGDVTNTDRAIIRPHGLTPSQKNLAATYKRLPAGMHFMLFSNNSLVNHSYEKNMSITEATIHTLLRYLTKRQQYSHIIIDVQCDDHKLIENILNSGYPIDKLCVVLTQDPHAISSAGVMITTLARARAASMVAGADYIVNRFNASVPINLAKIEKTLRLGSTQMFKISEDSAGYQTAAANALPYLINKGRFWMEYDSLRTKLLGVD